LEIAMYILTAEDIMKGTEAGSAGSACGTPAQDRFDDLQRIIRTRVEEALGVDTLDRVECRDSFTFVGRNSSHRNLRLANAFIDATGVSIIGSDGLALDFVEDRPALVIDRKYGIIKGAFLEPGTYTVHYTSGFVAEDGTKVYQGLPDWVKSIALTTFFLWRRAMNRGASPKDISHSALTNGMIRELHARVFQRYDRPRVDMAFHDSSERRPAGSTGEWSAW
jgi:hypothetical protein